MDSLQGNMESVYSKVFKIRAMLLIFALTRKSRIRAGNTNSVASKC